MKPDKIKKILCVCFPLLFWGTGAMAQTLMDGEVVISNLAVSRAEGQLFVSMDIDVSALKIKSDRELLVFPSLARENDSLALPPVMIAGRNRYYHHLRNGLSPENASLYRCGDVKTIEYRSTLPYEKWMARARLTAGGETRGCCSEALSWEDVLLARLDLEPRVFVPQFVYIKPEAVPKISVVGGTAYIDFPVNRTELHADYRRNPAELRKIRAVIDTVRNDADTRILSVSVKGHASPDGPYAANARLAEGRTETLKEYVRELYDFPDTLLTTAYEPEDWAGLERYVENSVLENREGILAIIRGSLSPDAKEWKLKSSYPKDYAFLLKEVYPGLRHSDYAVKYEVRAYSDTEELRRLLKTQPRKLSLNEMYLAAQEMQPGGDEFNETFEIAVRMFPEDPAANLNAANTAMSKGDLKNAGRYLAKAGDTPEAVYARGIHAALGGDYGTAERLFTQAGQAGIPEAEEALRRLEELNE